MYTILLLLGESWSWSTIVTAGAEQSLPAILTYMRTGFKSVRDPMDAIASCCDGTFPDNLVTVCLDLPHGC